MTVADAEWEKRVSDLWADIDQFDEDDFIGRVDALVAELPSESAIGLFERGAACE